MFGDDHFQLSHVDLEMEKVKKLKGSGAKKGSGSKRKKKSDLVDFKTLFKVSQQR